MFNLLTDIKKPPIAPKPKHASVQKPSPPPVAPKPDVVPAKSSPASKKLKPTIAPKPKVLQSSSVAEEWKQSNIKSNGIANDEHEGAESEKIIYKHETSANDESSNVTYIISPCSCSFDCNHRLGNGDSFQKTQKVIEQLENLENKKMCGQPVPCVRSRWKPCSQQQDKLAKSSQVILRASILEDKVKDVLTHNLFANGHACKQENSEKAIRVTGHNVIASSTESSECDVPFSNIEGHIGSTKKQLPVKEPAASSSQDVILTNSEHQTMDRVKECNGIPIATEHSGRSKLLPRAPPPHKSLPVPKPRKLRTPCLVRQDCVDGTAESIDDPGTLDSPQMTLPQGQNEADHPNDEYIIPDILDSRYQNIEKCESNVGGPSTELTPASVENEIENKSLEEDSHFKRCSSLSMSLPKQLKLIYEQQLPVKNAVVEKHLAPTTPAASSPRVAPKKPQRFSLPAAGLLKKAASEEKLHSSNDNGSYGTLGHVGTSQNQFQTSEKPLWKLEHPILPFLGNPESLKASLSSDNTNPLTKPRAKSLSSVDMNRIENHTNESPKKNALKKFLNLKLSVCVLKSDFQKFLSRGNLSGDSGTSDIFSCTGNSSSPTLERKVKPSKAQSADSFSPLSKKKQKNKNEFSIVNNPTSKSLDDSLVSLQRSEVASAAEIPECDIPQYENICHYEEIPEYENLPFTVISDINECGATIYEVEDPTECVHSSAGLHINHR